MSATPLCSIVIPVFREEDNLRPLYDRLRAVAEGERLRWEFVFVDDGSDDGSMETLESLRRADPRVKVIRLSRNFGSHAAVAAGLGAASGDMAIIMAADGQDPPEVIPRFLERYREGYDVVWGVRTGRKDPIGRRIVAAGFYRLIRRVALPNYPSGGTGSFCLISRAVMDTFASFKERNRVTFGLIAWSGFRQAEVPYERPARWSGTSGWTMGRLIKTGIDTLLGYSYAPVRFVSLLGLVIALPSLGYALIVLANAAITGASVPGWASLFVAILFLGGVQLTVLGVLGEYLWRILDETRGRPLYVVRDAIGVSRSAVADRTVAGESRLERDAVSFENAARDAMPVAEPGAVSVRRVREASEAAM